MSEHREPETPEETGVQQQPLWEFIRNQIKAEGRETGPKAFVEWAAILEKAEATGNPCDFVMEYRRLLHALKAGPGAEGFSGRWAGFWEILLLAADIAAGRQRPPDGNPWRLRHQSAAAPKNGELENRISLLAEKALQAVQAAAPFPFASMKCFPTHTPPTPESRTAALAHGFCTNFKKDPRLLLRADRMEIEALRLAAREFSPARDKSP